MLWGSSNVSGEKNEYVSPSDDSTVLSTIIKQAMLNIYRWRTVRILCHQTSCK